MSISGKTDEPYDQFCSTRKLETKMMDTVRQFLEKLTNRMTSFVQQENWKPKLGTRYVNFWEN